MDLRWLEDLLVLLEEGNLSRAARRRSVTQPAFSRRIRAVEHWLGHEVLDRRSNRVQIRDALRDNEGEIRALIRRVGELRQRIRHAEAAERTITVTTQHALGETLTGDLVLLARRELGAMTVRLVTADRTECMSTFLRGDADLLICYVAPGDPALLFDEEFIRTATAHDRLAPVVSPALVNANGRDALPCVTYPRASYLGQVLARAQRADQIRMPTGAQICDTEYSAAARGLALRGLGLAWVPASLARRDILSGDLVDLGDEFGRLSLEIALFARSSGPLKATVLNMMADAIAQLPQFAQPRS